MKRRSCIEAEGVTPDAAGPVKFIRPFFGLALLFAALASSAVAQPSALDVWREQARQTRLLAENDAPRAHTEAERLQASLPPGATAVDQAQALNLLARSEVYLAMTSQAAAHSEQAFSIAKQHGDRIGQAEADLNVALNAVNEGRIDKLITVSTHVLDVLQGVNRPDLLGEALLRSAMTYRRLGQIDDSVKTTLRAMEVAQRTHDHLMLTYAYQGLSISYNQSGHGAQAHGYLLHMRDEARAAHSKLLEGYALSGLATIYAAAKDYRSADAASDAALALFRQVGAPYGLTFALFGKAQNRANQGRCDEALPILASANRLYEEHPNKIGLWYLLNLRSSCELTLGDRNGALADAQHAYSLAKDIGLSIYLSESDQRIAKIAAAMGDYRRAYQLSVEAAEMTAKAEQQRIGAQVLEMAQRYEVESKQHQIDELTQRNQRQSAELRQRELQQRWLWTVICASAILLAGGAYFLLQQRRSHRMLEAVNNQLQQSQSELQQQTGILQSILDSMGDGVVVSDEQGRLILVNPEAERILGVGLTRAGFRELPEGYHLYLPDQTTPYPAQDLPLARAVRGESCEGVEVFARSPILADGRWLSVTGCPLIDKGGVAHGGVAVFSDITARKRTDAQIRALNINLEQRVHARTAELRLQTRYLRALFDTLPLSVWLKDTEGRYLAVNEGCAETFGLTVEEMVGKSDHDLRTPEEATEIRADEAALMAARVRKTQEQPMAGQGGAVWIETDQAPVLDEDGTVLGIVGVARDISERKAAEAAREAALGEAVRLARLRSEFMAQMSHELRTPLNAILGYAQILRRDRHLTSRQAGGLATIQASGQHLLTLINDILDLSRIEAGKLELNPFDIELATFLQIVGDIIRVKAEEKGLAFIQEIAMDLPVGVWADDRRLRQILLNLLGNAVKFTDEGSVTLRVKTVKKTKSRRQPVARLRFEVEDTGIGMTAGQMKHIFQPFEQASEGAQREAGAGLGLAISRQLVRLMASNIEVHSELDEGSLFWFELDLPIVAIPALGSAHAPERLAIGYEGPRKRVLIVDDALSSRAMMSDGLTSFGFDVLEASNGQEGLDLVQQSQLDLVVMDTMMPVMDGLEATRRIRALAEQKRIPIIAVTASASADDEAQCLSAGADDFMAKPITPDELLRRIAKHLGLALIHEPSAIDSKTAGPAPEPTVAPPHEELEALHRLALEGYVGRIRERAAQLMESDPRYKPFASQLLALADDYQSRAILTLIERFRDAEPERRKAAQSTG